MLNLTFTVSDLSTVMQIYDRIQIRRYTGSAVPSTTINIAEYTTVSGTDTISSPRTGVSDVLLVSPYTQYYFTDPDGKASDWYISRYYHEANDSASGWSDPILGDAGDLYYDPLYPAEISFGSAEQLVIDRIRLLIGDPIDLRREYGDDAVSSIHQDGRTYELDQRGWAASITVRGVSYTNTADPSINGYRFLRFADDISETTWSGCTEYGIDVWYYVFRNSDREIMEAYDTAYPPYPLTTANATSEVYMLQTAITLLSKELIEDSTEDGATIRDEGSYYSPEHGLGIREDMIDKLQKRLDDLVKSLSLTGITGVLID